MRSEQKIGGEHLIHRAGYSIGTGGGRRRLGLITILKTTDVRYLQNFEIIFSKVLRCIIYKQYVQSLHFITKLDR